MKPLAVDAETLEEVFEVERSAAMGGLDIPSKERGEPEAEEDEALGTTEAEDAEAELDWAESPATTATVGGLG